VAQRYLHGLAQAQAATFAAMAAVVEHGCEQPFQPFISNAPWRHEPVIEQIACDGDHLLGGKADSALIIDESSFVKQGNRSVGVARQWCGRLGKVDNCQVAVFAVLTDGARHTPVDMRLYLPQRWVDDPARCELAEIPPEARRMRSKTDIALELVRAARARGMRFGWVGVDGGYGKEPAFLRALDDMGEIFVADVHCDQRVWSEPPGLHVPAPQAKGQRRPPSKQQAAVDGITVESLVAGFARARLDPLHPAREHTRPVTGRYRASAGLGVGRRGSDGAVLASDRPSRGGGAEEDQVQPVQRVG